MTILELREKRAKAWETAKAFLDSHRNDKGIYPRKMTLPIPAWNRRSRILGKRLPGWSGRKPSRGNCPSR